MKKSKNLLTSERDSESIKKVKEIIESNPGQDHSIKTLTVKLGINRTKLTHGFKKIYGKSIHQFIITMRMGQAKSLLTETDKPIKAVAKLCGYRDVKNFLTAFKKYTGDTAAQYRRKI